MDQSMKEYCRTDDSCLRKFLLGYFGFSCKEQSNCCCFCDYKQQSTQSNPPDLVKVRTLPRNKSALQQSIRTTLELQLTEEYTGLFDVGNAKLITEQILEDIEFISSESHLLSKFGVWNEESCATIII